jgi:hypothetical protein
MAVVWRQWEAVGTWNGGCLEARGGCMDEAGGCMGGMTIIWRQEESSGMEWRSFGGKGRL